MLKSVLLIVFGLVCIDSALAQAPTKTMDWLADDWQTYFSPEFLRRGWFVSPYKTQADVPYPDQFYLRPLLYQDKFPQHRQLGLSPQIAARIAAQEEAGHIVFDINSQRSAVSDPLSDPPSPDSQADG